MTCEKFQAVLPEMMLDSASVPAHVSTGARQHIEECSGCRTEWEELRAVIGLLDEWKAPEPSPYFDTRMTARLRHEREFKAPGLLERLRTRLLLGSNLHLRPAMAATLALLLIAGAGSYEGYIHLDRTPPASTVSATVKDLELLDTNAQTLQQLAAFEDTGAAAGQTTSKLRLAAEVSQSSKLL